MHGNRGVEVYGIIDMTMGHSIEQGHECGIIKKGKTKSSKRIELGIFTHNFSKFRAFVMLHPPKRHVVLKILALLIPISDEVRKLT